LVSGPAQTTNSGRLLSSRAAATIASAAADRLPGVNCSSAPVEIEGELSRPNSATSAAASREPSSAVAPGVAGGTTNCGFRNELVIATTRLDGDSR
jgi:hypothetical protein